MTDEAEKASEMTRALIVLGMHRSGTSALAGLLHQSGVAMGSRLMQGRVGENDKGFWEHDDIVALHERLLKEMGYSWDDPRLLPVHWWETGRSQYYLDQICLLLDAEMKTEPLWAIKDPRMCRLMPLWWQVFTRLGVKPLFLHIVRNPLEVAASLERRDGLSRPLALLLWFQHNLEAVQHSAGYPRRFILFPQLLDHGEAWLQAVFQGWGLSAIARDHAGVSGAPPFLTRTLRHHQATDADLKADQEVPRLVKDLYQLLLEAASAEREPAPEQVQRIVQEYQEATTLLAPWTGLSAHFQGLLEKRNALLEKRDARIAELAPALKDAQRYVRERERDIERLNGDLAALTENIKTLQNKTE